VLPFLSTQDERIGSTLIEKDPRNWGLRDNTIIVFQSDNGHSTENALHGGGGVQEFIEVQTVFVQTGGIRVPASN